ncbi:MAG: malto-oligosyltrehalose trehalohydrolase [Bdellovibrionales bacterium]
MKIDVIDSGSERLGAWVDPTGGVRFRVWAPRARRVDLVWMGHAPEEVERVAMEPRERGYFEVRLAHAAPGGRYKFCLNEDLELPDPVSRFQPLGPHGPSQVVETDFNWTDAAWKGLPLDQHVIYELHVGTFSPEGTFAGVEKRLEHLQALGVNAIEIMPVAQFAGHRNWGYDGVGLYAAHNTYGGDEIAPRALKRLVDTCHAHGFAVFLDVVYNHLGPEGNCLSHFGPYFQDKYKTPWGEALNFDGEWNDEVRKFFLGNAKQWLEEFHFDGLRLDAVHAIIDASAQPFLEDLGRLKNGLQDRLGRAIYLIAETDSNDSRLLRAPEDGGMGMSGHWADDLHHTIHVLLTGEKRGYYADYGRLDQLASLYRDGVLFQGEWSPSRRRSHGRSYAGVSRSRLVVCSQNHDQVGNRMRGERLLALAGEEKMRLAAACVFLSPFLPLIFMGEEIAEAHPFMYFVDHTDKKLIEAVRKGRREEFSGFEWSGEAPDPAHPSTFEESRLNWNQVEEPRSQRFLAYYKRLIQLSKWIRREQLLECGHVSTEILAKGTVFYLRGRNSTSHLHIFFSFSSEIQTVEVAAESIPLEILLDSADDSFFDNSHPIPWPSGRTLREGKVELKPYAVRALRSG